VVEEAVPDVPEKPKQSEKNRYAFKPFKLTKTAKPTIPENGEAATVDVKIDAVPVEEVAAEVVDATDELVPVVKSAYEENIVETLPAISSLDEALSAELVVESKPVEMKSANSEETVQPEIV
jgi:nitrate reductase NapAB chaperone NapD